MGVEPKVEPFFGPPEVEGGRRRLILLSWHFPPANTTGALRWQRLASFVRDAGWGLDVITRAPDQWDRVEWKRMDDLPSDTRVYGLPFRESVWERASEAILSVVNGVRRLVGGPEGSGSEGATDSPGPASAGATAREPDPGLTTRRMARWAPLSIGGWKRTFNAWVEFARLNPWISDVVALGQQIVSSGRHDAVISCGPPHAAHTAAKILSNRTGLRMVMDLRDAWSLTGAVLAPEGSPLAFRLMESAERSAVERANLVVCNTEALMIAMRATHSGTKAEFVTVRNGCDTAESMPAGHRDKFRVAYAGAIYIDRDPRPLFRGAARVVAEKGLGPEAFTIEFMGHVQEFGGVPLRDLAREAGIEDHVLLHPPGPRSEALDFLATASVLVSLPQTAYMAIPSKIYEYMQYQAWLLAFAGRGSATELLLRSCDADVVEPGDVTGTADVLARRFDEFRAGVCPSRLGADPRFSREAEARRLVRALNDVLATGA